MVAAAAEARRKALVDESINGQFVTVVVLLYVSGSVNAPAIRGRETLSLQVS